MSNTIAIVLAIVTSLQLCVAEMTLTENCYFVALDDRENCGYEGVTQYICERLNVPGTDRTCCYDDGAYLGFENLPECFYSLPPVTETLPTNPPEVIPFVPVTQTPAPQVFTTTKGSSFVVTADPLGNTPPTGAIQPFGGILSQTRPVPNPFAQFPSVSQLATANPPASQVVTQTVAPNTPATPRAVGPTPSRTPNLQNLLNQLGIEVEGGSVSGQTSQGSGALGTNVLGNIANPVPGGSSNTQPSRAFTQAEKDLAFCTFYKTGKLAPQLESVFEVEICEDIDTTATPEFANEVMQAEINRLLAQAGAGRPQPTQATATPANPLAGNQNPFSSLLGGGLGGASSLGGLGQTNPLSSLLGNNLGGASGLAGLLGGSNNPLGGSSALGGLLGGNNGISSLLGNSLGGSSGLGGLLGGNNGISSLLGNSLGGSSGLGGLLGGNNGISSLLGNSLGGSSGLAGLLGGNSGLSSLLGGSNQNALSSLLGGGLGGGSTTSNLLGSLLGGGSSSGGSSNDLLQTLLLSQSFQGLNRQPQPQVPQNIGGLQPDFVGTPAPPRYNPFVCQALTSLSSGGGSTISTILRSQLLQQNNCFQGILSNPLFLLSGGGLNTIRDQLGPLLGITSSTTDESTGDQATGALDPNRIPYSVMTNCLAKRTEYNNQFSCKTGVHINIRTEVECFNIGCIFATGGMCFRCPLITKDMELNTAVQKTCSVNQDARTDCPGFQNTFLLSSLLNQGFAARSGEVNETTSDDAIDPRAPAVRQFGGLSSLGGLAGLGGLGGLTGGLGGLTGGLGGLTGGLGGLTGGLGGLTGGLGGLSGGLGGFGGLGGGVNNIILKQQCESKGCCWDSSNNLFSAQRACYVKEFPTGTDTSADCLGTLTCGKSPAGILARLLGGTVASSNTDRPWQVLIRPLGSNQVRCSGAILCSQWIVTAASCLQTIQSITAPLGHVIDINRSSLEVIVGTIDPASPLTNGLALGVQAIIPHPQYAVTQFTNDLAVLQVPYLNFMTNIQPVCLPTFQAPTVAVGTNVYVTGYGHDASGTQSTLKEIKLAVISYADCFTVYQTSLPVSGVFCANPVTAGEDTCIGDGGSPALSYDATSDTFTIVGISVGGSSQCSGSKPLVFLDVTRYREWIKNSANGCCDTLVGRSPSG